MEAIYERPGDYDLEHEGFSAETWFGDYGRRPLRRTSRQLIGVGRKRGTAGGVMAS